MITARVVHMNKSILKYSLLVTGITLLNSVHGDPIESLDTMVVTATRSPQNEITTPASIVIITADEIRESGADNIVEVLRNQGGLQISDLYGDGSRATISMRGFGGNAQANTLVLVDGRRLNNADLGNPDLNSVSLKDVERIEIMRGSAGVLYGDQAVGGVINIITRRPDKFHAGLYAGMGSYQHKTIDVEVENRHANGLGYRFSAEKDVTDNYRDNNVQDYKNLFGLLDYQYSSGKTFIEFQRVNENLKTPGALFTDQVRADRRQAFNPNDFIKTDTQNFRWGWQQSIYSGWDFITEYTVRQDTSNGILSVGGFGGPVDTKRDHREFTPRITGNFNTTNGNLLLTLGADLFASSFHLDSILGSIDDEQTQYAVYAQSVIPILKGLSLTLGGRRAYVKNIVNGALLPPDTTISDDVNAFDGGLSYQADDHWRFFGRVDSNYRFVLADEYTSASFGGVIPATQTGISWEMGFDRTGENSRINFTAYQLDLNKEIEFDPVLFINTNIGDTRRRGVILDVNYAPLERLSLGLNYGYVQADIVKGPLAGLDIPFVASHTIKLSAGYDFLRELHGQLEVLGITRRVAVGDFFNTGAPLAGHVTANAFFRYTHGPVSLGFKINNILDRKYSDNAQLGFRPPLFTPETAYFPAPERNFMVSFEYDFN
jgi:iron complex outermembrane receptor protein